MSRSIDPGVELLLARFAPAFEAIAARAAARDRDRHLPFEEVEHLRSLGFAALRVPVAFGGAGIDIPALFALLVRLGEADPNLVQILRAHFAFVEGQLGNKDAEARARWLQLVADGAVFGAAMAERTAGTETTATVRREGDGWRLDGTKYYCTGTLYASWIVAVARDGDDRVTLAVPADAPGVFREDDWNGFGQRLSGSGTTRFEAVRLDDGHVLRRMQQAEVPRDGYLTAFYQLFHLAALAGIARAVRADAVGFVRDKTRTFGVPGQSEPRRDPLVQRVVGRISANVLVLEALVERVAREVAATADAKFRGESTGADTIAVDITAFEAQQVAIDLAVETANLLFEVGGASATSAERNLDRHWRNARVLASHNPAAQRERMIGDYRLNESDPGDVWREAAARNGEKRHA
ncbi:acyl-CoA dehydrogenase family protein [Rhizosaccharibacter radicis]|uniref:Dibenzothiophene monooxygenase n=1 Tax=Rhizosaccharibacter radicis TaxID=2782605 RepID=A0ABT1W0Y2_9PROT|nr:acyl-CoA dehydrogenase family protein [Acetobacteraceae bacterium KSS12]